MDGDFLTLLPQVFSNNFLIYRPSLRTLSKHIGKTPPHEWLEEGLLESKISLARQLLIERTRLYFPELGHLEILGELTAIRSIDPNVKLTDRRISRVSETESGFLRYGLEKLTTV